MKIKNRIQKNEQQNIIITSRTSVMMHKSADGGCIIITHMFGVFSFSLKRSKGLDKNGPNFRL